MQVVVASATTWKRFSKETPHLIFVRIENGLRQQRSEVFVIKEDLIE